MISGKIKTRSSKKVKKNKTTIAVGDPFYSPTRQSDDQPIGFNLDRLSGGQITDNTGKTQSGGSDDGQNRKETQGILDDMEGDIDIDGYEEYKMPQDDKLNELKNDIANVK